MTFQPLVPGDTLGIVAPASSGTEDQMPPARCWLESFGYAVKLGKSVGAAIASWRVPMRIGLAI